MSRVDRAIILAAGRGHQLDGFTKVLLRHPKTGRTVLEHALDAFSGKQVTVVVGFRAIQVMEQFPHLDYVINHDWAITNNAHSLALALTGEPTFVVSGDTFFSRELIAELEGGGPDLVLTEARENRTLSAIHCELDGGRRVVSTYQGPVRSVHDPEALGLFKISDAETLRLWKRRSIEHANMFAGQTLPCDLVEISAADLGAHDYDEINTPADYLRLIEKTSAA